MKLRPKQEAFVAAYIATGNASEAYRRAGYQSKNPNVCGPRLLATVRIQEALAKKGVEVVEKNNVTMERVIARLVEIGFADMGDYISIDDDGLVSIDLRKAAAGTVPTTPLKKIRQREVLVGDETTGYPLRTTEVDFHDQLSALDKLMKHLGGYPEAAKEINVNMKAIPTLPMPQSIEEWVEMRGVPKQMGGNGGNGNGKS